MSRYSPTNPAADAILNLEAVMNRQNPMKIESKATNGLVSRMTPTAPEAKDDAMSRVAEYVKLIRELRDKNKQDG